MFCTTRLPRRDWELLMPTPCRHRRPPLGQAAKLPPFCSPSAAVGGACRRTSPSVMPVLTEPTLTDPRVIPLPPNSFGGKGLPPAAWHTLSPKLPQLARSGASNMTSLRSLLLVLLGIGVATPVAAWSNDSEQPGSVLVFPKFIRGTFNDVTGQSTQAAHAVTELEISVVCPKGQTCGRDPITGKFDKVFMRAHWVCEDCI